MLRLLPRGWVGTGLFAALLTCGCQHSRCCCSNCSAPTATASAPIIHTAAKHPSADPTTNRATACSFAQSYPDAQTKAGATFGHDAKYRWLMGALEYSPTQRTWLLHYLPYQENDHYGGCVALVGIDPQMRFKPGQIVRVEGSLIDPNSMQLQPAYEVQRIRPAGS
jgi:hypothetical protein